jgi:hypothetical protein
MLVKWKTILLGILLTGYVAGAQDRITLAKMGFESLFVTSGLNFHDIQVAGDLVVTGDTRGRLLQCHKIELRGLAVVSELKVVELESYLTFIGRNLICFIGIILHGAADIKDLETHTLRASKAFKGKNLKCSHLAHFLGVVNLKNLDCRVARFSSIAYVKNLKCRIAHFEEEGYVKKLVAAEVRAHGFLEAKNMEVTELAVFGGKTVVENSVLNQIRATAIAPTLINTHVKGDIIIENIESRFPFHRLEIEGNSLVEGDVTFIVPGGEVYLGPRSKLQGNVKNGILIIDYPIAPMASSYYPGLSAFLEHKNRFDNRFGSTNTPNLM